MTYMEIATQLGFVNLIFAEASKDIENDVVTPEVRQALCEAQLILYELARKEFINETNNSQQNQV